MKPKVIITVRGGVVQGVTANQNIDYILIDHDNIDQGQNPILYVSQPSARFIDGKAHTFYTDASDPREMEIRDELKRIKF